MLQEITLSSISKINGNKEPSVEDIEWYINKMNSANKKSVKNIILNFINIQTSLAFLYPYQNIYDTQGSQTLVGFIKEQDFSLQLESLKKIYSKVLLMQ